MYEVIGIYSLSLGEEITRHLRPRPAARDLRLSAWDEENSEKKDMHGHILFFGYFMQGLWVVRVII